MGEPAQKKATYADLEALPSNLVGELVHGTLHAFPRPALRHAFASSALGSRIGGPFSFDPGGPGGWVILDEPELHFGEDVLVPDLAGWRRARLPEVPDAAYLTLAPDWICEVLSPSTQAIDRSEKLDIYAREHVGHAWLVDPIAMTLEVLRWSEGGWIRSHTWRDDAEVRAEPFEEVSLPLASLWTKALKR